MIKIRNALIFILLSYFNVRKRVEAKYNREMHFFDDVRVRPMS